MNIQKSTINKTLIGNLPKSKVTITFKENGNSNGEGIWVAEDKENNLMYLLNHAVGFYPFPSWGMELPLKKEIDLMSYRGKTFEDTKYTLCEEAYNNVKEFLDEKGDMDLDKYFEFLDKLVNEKEV